MRAKSLPKNREAGGPHPRPLPRAGEGGQRPGEGSETGSRSASTRAAAGRGGRRRRDSAEARRRFLAAGLEVMAGDGYHGATTRRISRLAGLNEALLFRYFGSKRGLLGAVVEQGRQAEKVPTFSRAREYSLVEFLDAVARSAFEAYEDRAAFYRLVRYTQLEDPQVLREYGLHLRRARVEPVVRFLRAAQEKDLVRRDVPAEVLAEMFGGLVSYVLEQRILRLRPQLVRLSRRQAVDLIVDTFLQGANPLAFRPSRR